MLTTKTLSLSVSVMLTGMASAYIPDIRPRQTDGPFPVDGLSDECESAIEGLNPLYSELPTPPPVLLTATALPTDPCATAPPFTGEDLSEWDSYTSEVLDWYSSHSEAIDDALSSCSELASYGEVSVPMCTDTTATTDGAEGGATTTSDSTEKPSTTSGGETETSTTGDAQSSSTAEPTQAAAPRETGVVMAAAAIVAVGVWGFVL